MDLQDGRARPDTVVFDKGLALAVAVVMAYRLIPTTRPMSPPLSLLSASKMRSRHHRLWNGGSQSCAKPAQKWNIINTVMLVMALALAQVQAPKDGWPRHTLLGEVY